MNFEFSDEVTAMREEVRRILAKYVPVGRVRALEEDGEPFDKALWREAANLGWMGISLPEAHGGSGLDQEPLCMLSEELGRSVASLPFSSSIYFVADAIALFGNDDQKAQYLPALCSGNRIGAFALGEGQPLPCAEQIQTTVLDGRIRGRKLPVWDGLIANLFLVVARDADGAVGLYLADADACRRQSVATIEYGRSAAILEFDGAAESLPGAKCWSAIERLLDRAAVLLAFEAIGGAQAALDMALDYAKQRFAFGRPIGSMQAIKHMLADVYVAIELARSNAYYGAWALAHDAPDLTLAAASARLAANDAYEKAASQAIQVHGGMGFTQEVDCHIHYRRAKRLAVEIGPRRYWSDRLVTNLPPRNG